MYEVHEAKIWNYFFGNYWVEWHSDTSDGAVVTLDFVSKDVQQTYSFSNGNM